jgi:hypothetical protein
VVGRQLIPLRGIVFLRHTSCLEEIFGMVVKLMMFDGAFNDDCASISSSSS